MISDPNSHPLRNITSSSKLSPFSDKKENRHLILADSTILKKYSRENKSVSTIIG